MSSNTDSFIDHVIDLGLTVLGVIGFILLMPIILFLRWAHGGNHETFDKRI